MLKIRKILFRIKEKVPPPSNSVQFLVSLAENSGKTYVREKEYFDDDLNSAIKSSFNEDLIFFERDINYPGFIRISLTELGFGTLEHIGVIARKQKC